MSRQSHSFQALMTVGRAEADVEVCVYYDFDPGDNTTPGGVSVSETFLYLDGESIKTDLEDIDEPMPRMFRDALEVILVEAIESIETDDRDGWSNN